MFSQNLLNVLKPRSVKFQYWIVYIEKKQIDDNGFVNPNKGFK